jgi:hypothetical protein
MAVTFKRLIPSKILAGATSVEFTANGTHIIDRMTLTNTGSGDAQAYVYLVDSGTAGASNAAINGRTLAAGETWNCPELSLHVLPSGAAIAAYSTGTVVIRCSGRQVA